METSLRFIAEEGDHNYRKKEGREGEEIAVVKGESVRVVFAKNMNSKSEFRGKILNYSAT